MDTRPIEVEVLHGFGFLARAKDQTQRPILPRLTLMPIQPPQIDLDLTEICGWKSPNFNSTTTRRLSPR